MRIPVCAKTGEPLRPPYGHIRMDMTEEQAAFLDEPEREALHERVEALMKRNLNYSAWMEALALLEEWLPRTDDRPQATVPCLCGADTARSGKWGWVNLFYHLDEDALSQDEADAVLAEVRDLEKYRLCWRDFTAFLTLLDAFYATLYHKRNPAELIALLNAYMKTIPSEGVAAPCQNNT